VFIDWVSEDVTLEEVDDWVNNIRKDLDPEAEITFACEVCGKNAATFIGPDVQIPSTIDQLKNTIPPDMNKPARLRLANIINSIIDLYGTLRKLNFGISLHLKEDIVSETMIYFLNRWDKYEYNPNTTAIAVQKYKSINIDIYRKEKKHISVDDSEEVNYLPKILEDVEGLPEKELEKKEDFRIVKEGISKMDEMCREILMYVADGKSESEIQKILDIPLGTVSSRKSNCIKKLAEIIKA
jgi:RNA polymerase sigma factor (sigma-70 family)